MVKRECDYHVEREKSQALKETNINFFFEIFLNSFVLIKELRYFSEGKF